MPASAPPLVPDAVTEAGRVFLVPAPALAWLGPGLILAGMALQLGLLALCQWRGGGFTRQRILACLAGVCLVFIGAALDRDVSVAVGEALALTGIWFAWRRG